jgi:hypothetical protein
MTDNVNRPKHYTRGTIEPIDFIRSGVFSPVEVLGYLKITAWVYLTRHPKDGVDDFAKAEIYAKWAKEWAQQIENSKSVNVRTLE